MAQRAQAVKPQAVPEVRPAAAQAVLEAQAVPVARAVWAASVGQGAHP